jgi:hypothetical protein
MLGMVRFGEKEKTLETHGDLFMLRKQEFKKIHDKTNEMD